MKPLSVDCKKSTSFEVLFLSKKTLIISLIRLAFHSFCVINQSSYVYSRCCIFKYRQGDTYVQIWCEVIEVTLCYLGWLRWMNWQIWSWSTLWLVMMLSIFLHNMKARREWSFSTSTWLRVAGESTSLMIWLFARESRSMMSISPSPILGWPTLSLDLAVSGKYH